MVKKPKVLKSITGIACIKDKSNTGIKDINIAVKDSNVKQGMIDRQDVFLRYYLDSSNKETYLMAGKAGVKAGYKEKSAWRIPFDTEEGKYKVIQSGIERYRDSLIKAAASISPEKVLSRLSEGLELLKDIYSGKPSGLAEDARYLLPALLKNLEIAAKQLGMLVDRREVDVRIAISQADQTKSMMDTIRLLNIKCPVCNEPVEIELNQGSNRLVDSTVGARQGVSISKL